MQAHEYRDLRLIEVETSCFCQTAFPFFILIVLGIFPNLAPEKGSTKESAVTQRRPQPVWSSEEERITNELSRKSRGASVSPLRLAQYRFRGVTFISRDLNYVSTLSISFSLLSSSLLSRDLSRISSLVKSRWEVLY